MTPMKRAIVREDIIEMERYGRERAERRQRLTAIKRNRRLEVGPFATFYFENYDTMLHQIHEMLYVERGGEEQIEGELAAYNPLIPNGGELVATVMFEIDDPVRRASALARLGGVEETATITIGDEVVRGVPEADIDRTSAAGKASAVQFIHFPFSPSAIEAFTKQGAQVIVGFEHPQYAHMAVMPEAVRAALAEDFD
ncbi:MAG: DUF3501 family protein [Alphaproteobacteria bacterium]|nr:DUF3501 family protein [Alphaproteobacteria bacterium]